jgi:hypothetical protein
MIVYGIKQEHKHPQLAQLGKTLCKLLTAVCTVGKCGPGTSQYSD